MNNNTPPNNKGNGNNNGGKAPKNTQNMLMFAVFVIAAILVWVLFNNQYTQATSQEITYDKFLDMLEADEVASVEDTGSTWKITPKEKDKDGVTLTYYTGKMHCHWKYSPWQPGFWRLCIFCISGYRQNTDMYWC